MNPSVQPSPKRPFIGEAVLALEGEMLAFLLAQAQPLKFQQVVDHFGWQSKDLPYFLRGRLEDKGLVRRVPGYRGARIEAVKPWVQA